MSSRTIESGDSLSVAEQALRLRVAQSAEVDTSNRSDPTYIDKNRHVVIVIGMTGSGKSSTANTMRHANRDAFEVSGSITSVTQSVAFRDYSLDVGGVPGQNKVDFRVIDTPGLQDTNRKAEDQISEFKSLASLAPHGVSAFLVCVPMGRVTDEHEKVLQVLVDLFGREVVKHSALVVTSARVKQVPGKPPSLLNRNELTEQIGKLPPGHFLRKWVESAGWRLVGVENILEPYRTQSSLRLHQAVMDTVEANHGERYVFRTSAEFLQALAKDKLLSGNRLNGVKCRQDMMNGGQTGKIILTIVCEIDR